VPAGLIDECHLREDSAAFRSADSLCLSCCPACRFHEHFFNTYLRWHQILRRNFLSAIRAAIGKARIAGDIEATLAVECFKALPPVSPDRAA
jgi:hypothetical protein